MSAARFNPRSGAIVTVLTILLGALFAACADVSTSGRTQVGNQPIAFSLTGRAAPTVVFQAGLGDGKGSWAAVLPTVAETNLAFAYDRPGYGDSAANEAARDPCTIAAEERQLLHAAGAPPPYILVGHSAGGLYQFVFAKLYPEEVAGLVLVDATFPNHWQAMQQEAPAAASLMRVARTTLFTTTERREFDDMGQCLERLDLRQPLAAAARVLVRTRFESVEAGAFEAMTHRHEAEWLNYTGAARIETIPGSGHYIQKDNPQAVIAAIASVSAAWRNNSQPLQ